MSLNTFLHVYWLFGLSVLNCLFSLFAYFMSFLCILLKSPYQMYVLKMSFLALVCLFTFLMESFDEDAISSDEIQLTFPLFFVFFVFCLRSLPVPQGHEEISCFSSRIFIFCVFHI